MRSSVLSALLLVIGTGASATVCTVDQVPAATLLVPYFEVDLGSCGLAGARTTIMTLINSDAAPALVQVTLWTDTSVPAHHFELYLTGYDVETIDLADALCTGSLANRFIGQPDQNDGLCYGFDHGDLTARGYVTLDSILQSSPLTPADETYHTDVLSTSNQLVGYYRLQNGAVSSTFAMAHIEADDSAFGEGNATYYGRYTTAVPDGKGGFVSSAADRREPLPTAWIVRYSDGARLHVWREGDGEASPFPCAQQAPSWYPLASSRFDGGLDLVVFDDAENAVIMGYNASPLETQAIVVGPGGDLPVPFSSGWIVFWTRHNGVRFAETAGQSWVTAEASAGFQPMALDSACNIPSVLITPTGPINGD